MASQHLPITSAASFEPVSGRLGTPRFGPPRLAHLGSMTESSPRTRPALTLVSVDNDAGGTGSHGSVPIEPVITVAELAAHLEVSSQAIYDLRHKRRGPWGFKVGQHLHFRLSEASQPNTRCTSTSPVARVPTCYSASMPPRITVRLNSPTRRG